MSAKIISYALERYKKYIYDSDLVSTEKPFREFRKLISWKPSSKWCILSYIVKKLGVETRFTFVMDSNGSVIVLTQNDSEEIEFYEYSGTIFIDLYDMPQEVPLMSLDDLYSYENGYPEIII